MTDDKLLDALGRAARERAAKDPLDQRWDALSAGELSEDQVEALAALAARGAVPAEAPEAFRPLDEAFRRTVAEQVATALGTDASTGSVETGGEATPIPFPARRKTAPSRTRYAPVALAASVMLAVGIGFFALPRGAIEPLPGYSASLQGGASSRSGSDTGTVFRPGDRFELRLVPETAVDGPVTARLYLENGSSLAPLAAPPATIAPTGAARIVGQTGTDVLLPDGVSTVVVVLSRDTAVPDEAVLHRELAHDDTATGKGWRAWRLTVTAEP